AAGVGDGRRVDAEIDERLGRLAAGVGDADGDPVRAGCQRTRVVAEAVAGQRRGDVHVGPAVHAGFQLLDALVVAGSAGDGGVVRQLVGAVDVGTGSLGSGVVGQADGRLRRRVATREAHGGAYVPVVVDQPEDELGGAAGGHFGDVYADHVGVDRG